MMPCRPAWPFGQLIEFTADHGYGRLSTDAGLNELALQLFHHGVGALSARLLDDRELRSAVKATVLLGGRLDAIARVLGIEVEP